MAIFPHSSISAVVFIPCNDTRTRNIVVFTILIVHSIFHAYQSLGKLENLRRLTAVILRWVELCQVSPQTPHVKVERIVLPSPMCHLFKASQIGCFQVHSHIHLPAFPLLST